MKAKARKLQTNILGDYRHYDCVQDMNYKGNMPLIKAKQLVQDQFLRDISQQFGFVQDHAPYNMFYPFCTSDKVILKICDELDIDYSDVVYNYTKSPDPIQLWKGFLNFFEPLPDYKITKEDRAIMRDVVRQIFPKKVEMYTFEQVLNRIGKETSAGYGFKGTKKAMIEQRGVERMVEDSINYLFDGRTLDMPCKFATKGKVSDIHKPKSRLIWVYPIFQSILEGIVAFPLYDQVLKQSPESRTMFVGTGSFQQMIRMCSNCSATCSRITLDWSGFDQHVPAPLLVLAIECLFDRVAKRFEGNLYNGRKYWKVIRSRTLSYFIHTPFVLPNGCSGHKHQGVPSGSPFTQIVDSVVNLFMVKRIISNKLLFPHVLGDDLTFQLQGGKDKACDVVEQIGYEASVRYGAILNGEKCCITVANEEHKFLGYYSNNGINRGDRDKLFASLILSSDGYNPWLSKVRITALMYLGAHDDPRFQRIRDELLLYSGGHRTGFSLPHLVNKVKYVLGMEFENIVAASNQYIVFKKTYL